MKKIKKIFESIKLKWLKDRILTLVLIAILIAAFFGINIGVSALNLSDIDLTEEKLFTLTDKSKDAIAAIPDDEEINIYLFDYLEDDRLVDLAKQYAKVKNNIKVEVTTATERADLAEEYEIQTESYSILIISGNKHKVINQAELSTFDYSTGNQIDVTEQRLTNSIISVSSIGKIEPIYVLTGHKEYSVASNMSIFKQYLELENYELKDLDLLKSDSVPEDCETLIIASPRADFTDYETDIIKKYINNGGNIVWFNDAFAKDDKTPNIQSILDLYGVVLDRNGLIIEQDANKMIMQQPNIIIPTIQYSGVTSSLYGNGLVLFFSSGRLRFAEDSKLEKLKVTKTDLLSTSDTSFFRTKLDLESLTATKDDDVGSSVVGAVMDKTVKDATDNEEAVVSSLVIYANNIFILDESIGNIPAIYFYNNLDLALGTIGHTAEAPEGLVIRKSVESTYYTATQAQDTIIKIIIFVVPVLIVILGIVVWQIRRRKK